MSLNSNKDLFNDLPAFFYSDNVSPYLSPLVGLNPDDSSHQEDAMVNNHKEMMNQGEQNLDIDNEQEKEEFGRSGYSFVEEDEDGNEIEENEADNDLQGSQIQRWHHQIKSEDEKSIKSIIQFLVSNSAIGQKQLAKLGKYLYQDSKGKQYIFETLMPKFTKLRKTKEQMTKYCMRKAFNFISGLKTCKAKKKTIKNGKKQEIQGIKMEMPFKKNSQDKTMNSNFLKKIFGQQEFLQGYRKFIENFSKLIEDDNEAKIQFLAQMIQKYLKTNQLQKIANIKRLPWTKTILQKTEVLAQKLMEFGENTAAQIQEQE